MNQRQWQDQKQRLIKQLDKTMDFLIGSVVAYRHKCGRTCHCNKGKGHIGFYLSVNREGKTKNFYLNKEAVEEARSMAASYGEVKRLLKEISEVNYHLLRESFPKRRRSKTKQQPEKAI